MLDIRQSLWFAVKLAATLALLAGAVFSAWDWIENPSEIFHDASGTNWGFVRDTAVSWIVPTFLQSSLIFFGLHLAWNRFKKNKGGLAR